MKKILLIVILIVVLVFLFATNKSPETPTPVPVVKNDSLFTQIQIIKDSVFYAEKPRYKGMFTRVVLTTSQPVAELTKLVGDSNVDRVLRLNRIDREALKTEMTIIVPKNMDELKEWRYMPSRIIIAKSLPKLVIISQPTQSFGVYENGVLVRSGPISSGKKSTPTPSGLFFVNWKGEEVISTFDDEWVLLWNMNIDNLEGIALHQYSLPGYPASHSCVRLAEADAYWLYQWTDEWIFKKGELVTEGTPVVIHGEYDFDNPPPWTLLPENPKSTDTSKSILENLVKRYLEDIKSRTMKL